MRACSGCHGPVGYAAATRLVLSGEVQSDYTKVRALVNPAAPAASPLITKGAGEIHGGGPVIPAGSADQALLLGWDRGGRRRARRAARAGRHRATDRGGAERAGRRARAAAGFRRGRADVPHGGGGVGLPMGLMLNGRFDLA